MLFGERDGRSLWDATLGGRVGVWRYGNRDPFHPQGWEIDFEGAAMPRLTLDSIRDLQTVDFRAGVPITYGIDKWQFKTGYYHLSSHLGDEYIISHPGSINSRLNYVRDSLVLGASYFPSPSLRLYSEAGYAFNADGGAEPWEFQLGTEYSKPGPTGVRGTPFVAINGHLLEEHDFGGSHLDPGRLAVARPDGPGDAARPALLQRQVEPVPDVRRQRTAGRLRAVVRLLAAGEWGTSVPSVAALQESVIFACGLAAAFDKASLPLCSSASARKTPSPPAPLPKGEGRLPSIARAGRILECRDGQGVD